MVVFGLAFFCPFAKVFVVRLSPFFCCHILIQNPTSMTAPSGNQAVFPSLATVAGVHDSSKETDHHTPSEPKASPGLTLFWPLLLGATSIVVAYFLARKGQRPATALSEVYALCSERDNSVYIVDSNNNKVQCVVVNGSYIADIGSLGECGVWYSQEKQ
jgi:hypothetical protein